MHRLVLLLSLVALGNLSAQSGSFVIPANRDSGGTDFAYWDLFARPPGSPSNTNFNYANPPALLDGSGEDDNGNPTTAFAPRAALTQTGTSTAFITSSGAIYSFSDPLAVEVHYQAPAGNSNEVTNVIFQTQTGGARIDIGSIRLRYTNVAGTHELAPVFKALDDPQTGAFSERIVSAYQWNLTGLGVTTFKIVFPGPTSMPLWQAQLDVVQGTAFSQQLGYVLRTRARPLTRYEVPGTVDKNLPPTADGRFFFENDMLNLLAVPEPDWEHTGWEYAGQTFATASLPLIFPAADTTVTALFAPSSYAIWREYSFNHANALLGVGNEFLDDAISAPAVDHDSDGLTNAGEYAFAGDPYLADTERTQPQLVLFDVSGTAHPAIRYRTNAAPALNTDVVFKAQLSTDGGSSWQDNSTVPTTVIAEQKLQPDGSMLVTERTVQPLSSLPAFALRVAWLVDGTAGTPLAPAALALGSGNSPVAGAVGSSYTHSFSATGGTAPYDWTLDIGTLPPGLTLSSAGALTGTPTSAGNFSATLRVTDAVTQSLTLPIEITIAPYAISSGPVLARGSVGIAYSTTLNVAGGTAPFSWSVESGSLPAGLTLSSSGILSGTPNAAGNSSFTIEVTDANDLVASASLSLNVVNLAIVTPSTLPGAVINVPYNLTLTTTGAAAPVTWNLLSGSLPSGLSLSSAGVLSGTPTTASASTFTLLATDDEDVEAEKTFTLTVHATYQVPVIQAVVPPVATVGASYSHVIAAVNYPSKFIVTGIPTGLKLNTATGEIAGRPTTAGVFNLQIRASNIAGTSTAVTLPLVVKPIARSLLGSFSGWTGRDTAANSNLGSRWSLTVAANGSYTLKLTTGSKSSSAKGFLAASVPQVIVSLAGQTLSLSLDANTALVSGTHGAAQVHGWRSVWNTVTQPAVNHAGYYSVALTLANAGDSGVLTVPQGAGFSTFTVSPAGTLTAAGRTADGQAISSAALLGPSGQIAVIAPLYKNTGSLLGQFTLAADPAGNFADNAISGQLSWAKAGSFGPLPLKVEGGYLAPSPKGGVVLGLPAPGNVSFLFTDGGLAESATDPDLSALPFTDAFRFLPPASAVKHSITLNKSTGAISGSFTLTELNPPLVRKVTFQAQVIRTTDGSTRALGHFLLKPLTTPTWLSGGVRLAQ